MTALLEVEGLEMRYPSGTFALRGVSFGARAGELTVILGPNGSGKTTLFRCIVRLADPSGGRVVVDGFDYTRARGEALRQARLRLGLVPQGGNLVARRSAKANVATGCLGRVRTFATACGRLPAAELNEAERHLARVGLADLCDRRVDTLSGGQAQRVAIARALHQRPAVLLADEPVSALDPDAAHDVMSLLRALAHDEGLAVVAILHQVELAQRYADRLIALRDGSVAFDTTANAIDPEALGVLYRSPVPA